MIWGQFLASQLHFDFLQYPPFWNLHRCLSFWKARARAEQRVESGVERVKSRVQRAQI